MPRGGKYILLILLEINIDIFGQKVGQDIFKYNFERSVIDCQGLWIKIHISDFGDNFEQNMDYPSLCLNQNLIDKTFLETKPFLERVVQPMSQSEQRKKKDIYVPISKFTVRPQNLVSDLRI